MKRVDMVAHTIIMLDTVPDIEFDITYTPTSLENDHEYFNFVYCTFVIKKGKIRMYLYLRGTRFGYVSSAELMVFDNNAGKSLFKMHFSNGDDIILIELNDNLRSAVIKYLEELS